MTEKKSTLKEEITYQEYLRLKDIDGGLEPLIAVARDGALVLVRLDEHNVTRLKEDGSLQDKAMLIGYSFRNTGYGAR
jgi:hypothetical protein